MAHQRRQPFTHCTPITLLVTLAGVALATGCEGATPSAAPTVENVAEETHKFSGERHTLLGEVDEVYSDRAFMLEEREAIIDDEVLVLTRQPIQLTGTRLQDDLDVFVTGTVHELVVPEIEKELAWDLDSKLEVEFTGHPVVIADRIEAMETFATWSEKDMPQGQVVSIWAMYAAPMAEQLEGRTIDLQSVEVVERGPKTLWIGVHGHTDMLVAAQPSVSLSGIEKGELVHIEGTVKRLPELDAVAESWELSQQDRQRLAEGDLYLEATRVEPAPASAEVGEQAKADEQTSG